MKNNGPNNLSKNQFYISIFLSFVLFIILNFIVGPTSIFGLAEFIQNITGYFFGVGTSTLDYFLISLIPFAGLLINYKRKINSFTEILKTDLMISLSCIGTFSVGLCVLISKIGSPGENPLLPEYLRLEPFKEYSSFLIVLGIILAFLLVKYDVKETENIMEQIGVDNE